MPDENAETLIAALKQAGLLDAPTETAFRAIPRAAFLPDLPPEQVYKDEAVPIKIDEDGTVLSSSSQPSMMAIMLRQLDLKPGQNVLEIGTGTGYNAALIQHIVGDEGKVTTIEIDATVAENARANLQRVSMGEVFVVVGDGALGYVPRANYDRIIVTAGIWDVPQAWVRQMKSGAILVAPLWMDSYEVSAALKIQSGGSLYSDDNRLCAFVRLRGQAAGQEVFVRIGTSGLYLGSGTRMDSAAVQMLLSDDAEDIHLGRSLNPSDYWNSLLPYLMLHVPENFILARYYVTKDEPAFGLTGHGFALMMHGSACFVELTGNGLARSFGSADALLAVQDALVAWERAGRPHQDRLRLLLLPKGNTPPLVKSGKLYPRRDHDFLVWLDMGRA